MVSKIRSWTNQTVDEVHQKKKCTSIFVERGSFGNSPFLCDRLDHDIDFVVNDKQVFLPLTFAVEFARNGILTAVRTIPRKHRTR